MAREKNKLGEQNASEAKVEKNCQIGCQQSQRPQTGQVFQGLKSSD